jgi:hypothetical protein
MDLTGTGIPGPTFRDNSTAAGESDPDLQSSREAPSACKNHQVLSDKLNTWSS